MKFSVRFILSALALSAHFGTASAQNPLVLNKLTEWNNAAPVPADQVLKLEVRKVADRRYSQVATCPDSDIVLSKVEPATADPRVINGHIRGTLRNGWLVTAQISKCDSAPVRFMVFQQVDGELKTIRVNRGTSYAWESLISDTLPLAQLGAYAALKQKGVSCDTGSNAILGITRISSEEPDLGPVLFGVRYRGSWTEIWPLDLCNRTVEVVVGFTADGDGGAFNRIAGDKARILP
jgi:hypothetical protein